MSISKKQPTMPGMKKPVAARRTLPLWLGEIHLVRRALLCFAATLSISLILLALSASYRQQQAQQRDLAQKARTQAASRFNQVEAEKLEIRAYGPRFTALQQRGLIGEENRLAWIDAIVRSQERRKLLPLTYDIGVQQVLKVPLPLSMGEYQLRASKMQLHLDLLHERDLLDLLHDLRRAGYFAVQDCAIGRSNSGAPAGNTLAPSLSADCSLLWLTLGEVRQDAPVAYFVPAKRSQP